MGQSLWFGGRVQGASCFLLLTLNTTYNLRNTSSVMTSSQARRTGCSTIFFINIDSLVFASAMRKENINV
jgi:hypothetical protein